MKRLRLERGWSQEHYAHEAEVHRTYISDLERAARNPSLTILDRLAAPLGVSASQLIEEVGKG